MFTGWTLETAILGSIIQHQIVLWKKKKDQSMKGYVIRKTATDEQRDKGKVRNLFTNSNPQLNSSWPKETAITEKTICAFNSQQTKNNLGHGCFPFKSIL